jgi:hypothetical protein
VLHRGAATFLPAGRDRGVHSHPQLASSGPCKMRKKPLQHQVESGRGAAPHDRGLGTNRRVCQRTLQQIRIARPFSFLVDDPRIDQFPVEQKLFGHPRRAGWQETPLEIKNHALGLVDRDLQPERPATDLRRRWRAAGPPPTTGAPEYTAGSKPWATIRVSAMLPPVPWTKRNTEGDMGYPYSPPGFPPRRMLHPPSSLPTATALPG